MNIRDPLNQLLSDASFYALDRCLRDQSAFHILDIATWERSHAALVAWRR